jgi:signal transduction histidine kinase
MADKQGAPFTLRKGFTAPRRWIDAGMVILDSGGRTLEANAAFGKWRNEWDEPGLPEDFWPFLQARAPEYHREFEKLLGGASSFGELTFHFASGEEDPESHWFDLEMARHPSGMIVRVNSTLPPPAGLDESACDDFLQNEPARRQLFVRLLRAEAQLESLMRRWPCVIFSQRPDFSFEYVGPQIEGLAGISVEQCRNDARRFWQLVHEADAAELQQKIEQAVSNGGNLTATYRIRHVQTGRITCIFEQRQALLSRHGRLLGYDVIWMDVTRQTIAEKRLCTAAWKETLAVLTLGVAHDFSNIMAGIHSLSESFLDQVDSGHSFFEGLGLIKSNSLQASRLVQQMIRLHLEQTGGRTYIDLNPLVLEIAELLRKILPRRIQITAELSAHALAIYADAVELRQVLINLTLNAADAMPQGGVISLRSSVHATLPPLAQYRGVLPRQPAVCLAIEDAGCGIQERHLAALFDPFFTTKTQSGSGLGLYNARLFVEKHQGAISIESLEGKGSCFRVWLPQADFSEAAPENALAQNPILRHTLLVHGRPGAVLEEMTEFLRSQGFHVVPANAPEAAGDYLQSVDYEFSAVLVLLEPNETMLAALIAELEKPRRRKFKRIVQLIGCDRDEIGAQTLSRFDLVLSPELSPEEQLRKLRALLETRPEP